MLFKRHNAIRLFYLKKIYKKYRFKWFKIFKNQKPKNRIGRKIFDFRRRSFFILKDNRGIIQTIFLKQFMKQNRITKFFSRFKHKSFLGKTLLFELSLFNIMVQTTFSFFKKDIHFFINKGFVFVNGFLHKNMFSTLKLGDRIQMTLNKQFYLYNVFSRYWIRKVVYKIKCRINHRAGKVYTEYKKKTKHTPNWILKSLFYQNKVPKYLEINYQVLTAVIVKWPLTVTEFNLTFLKFISYPNLPLYNWKRIA